MLSPSPCLYVLVLDGPPWLASGLQREEEKCVDSSKRCSRSFRVTSTWSVFINQFAAGHPSHLQLRPARRAHPGNAAQVNMADEEQPDHPVFKQVRQPEQLQPHLVLTTGTSVSTLQATVKELLRLSHEPNTRSEPSRFLLRFASLDLAHPPLTRSTRRQSAPRRRI